MGRWLSLCFVASLSLGCEPSTTGVNINSPMPPTYAQVRFFNFQAGLGTSDSIVSVQNQLPVAFGALAAPAVTGYQPEAVGSWTAYVSVDEATVATSAAFTADVEGDLYTIVETGQTDGGTPTAFTFVHEAFPAVTGTQAAIRLVVGAPTAAGSSVTLGTTTLTSSATLGLPTAWTSLAPAASAITVAAAGVTTTFAVTSPAAGSLHTYAVVVQPSSGNLVLLDITEVPGKDSTSTLVAPST